jgi:prepilin-type N-terminal cleavage/methylation domain-containing protein
MRRQRSVRRRQSGFTLVEMVVAVALFAILSLAVTESIGGVVRWYGKMVTAHRLASLQTSLTQAYRENIVSAEANTGSVIALTTGSAPGAPVGASGAAGAASTGILAPTNNTPGGRCTSTATTFAAAGPYLNLSTTEAYLDGYAGPLCLFITDQQSMTSGGVSLYYHSMAVVSMGGNGRLSAGTTFSQTGELTLGGDNQGVVIDGRQIALQQFGAARDRTQKIVDALQSYFLGRFQASPSPTTTVDYFGTTAGSTSWDDGGTLPVTSAPADMTAVPTYYTALGLSLNDVVDPYGQPFFFDNGSSAVRSPANPSASLNNAPPWSAAITTTLPGGVAYGQSAVGTY